MNLEPRRVAQLNTFRIDALRVHPDFGDGAASESVFRKVCYDWLKLREPVVQLWNGRDDLQGKEAIPDFANFDYGQALKVFAQATPVPTTIELSMRYPALVVIPTTIRLHDVLLGSFKTLKNWSREMCPECSGRGRLPAQGNCARCFGTGVVELEEKVHYEVVPGVQEGQLLRFPEQGDYSSEHGKRGDLVLVFQEKLPPDIRRQGAHLEIPLPVDTLTLLLGGTAQVADLSGDPIMVRIPEAAPEGTILRVAGKGLPYVQKNGRGDLLLRLQARFPKLTDNTEKALIKELYAHRTRRERLPVVSRDDVSMIVFGPAQDTPELPQRLDDAVRSCRAPWVFDVRAFGSRLPENVVAHLLDLWRKNKATGKINLICEAGLESMLVRMQIASLFQLYGDPSELDGLTARASLNPVQVRGFGRWELLVLASEMLDLQEWTSNEALQLALAPSGAAFRAIDMTTVVLVDSHVASVLVALARYTISQGGRLAILAAKSEVKAYLALAGFAALSTFAESIDELDD